MGFEPATCCLQNSCSAVELRRQCAITMAATEYRERIVPVSRKIRAPKHSAHTIVAKYTLVVDFHATKIRYGGTNEGGGGRLPTSLSCLPWLALRRTLRGLCFYLCADFAAFA